MTSHVVNIIEDLDLGSNIAIAYAEGRILKTHSDGKYFLITPAERGLLNSVEMEFDDIVVFHLIKSNLKDKGNVVYYLLYVQKDQNEWKYEELEAKRKLVNAIKVNITDPSRERQKVNILELKKHPVN